MKGFFLGGMFDVFYAENIEKMKGICFFGGDRREEQREELRSATS